MSDNYAKKIAKGSAIVFSISIVGAFLGYLLRLYLSRILSVEDFGLVFAILAFVGLISMFYKVGMDSSIVKHIPEFLEKKKFGEIKASYIFILCLQITIASIIFLPFVLFSDYFAVNYFHSAASSLPFVVIIMSSVTGIFLLLNQKMFQGFGKMGMYSAVEPIRVILTIAFAYIFVLIGMGNVLGIAFSYLLSAIATSIVTFVMLTQVFSFLKNKIRFSKETQMSLFAFAIPSFVGGMGSSLLGQIDTIVLTYFRNLSEVGLYQIALPTSQWLSYFIASLTVVLFPTIAELWAKKKDDLLSATVKILIKFSFLFIIPLALIFIAFPEIVIRMLFGNDFLHAARALQILSVGSIFLSVAMIFSTTLSGIGKPILNTKTVFMVVILNIILNLALIPVFGATGAALATTISYFIMMVISAYYIRKSIKISLPVTSLIKMFIAGFLTLALILYMKNLIIADPWTEAFLCMPVGLALYFIIVLKLKAVVREDLQALLRTGIPVPKRFVDMVSKWISE